MLAVGILVTSVWCLPLLLFAGSPSLRKKRGRLGQPGGLVYKEDFFLKGGESFTATLGESPSSCESLGPANAASQALSDSDLELTF